MNCKIISLLNFIILMSTFCSCKKFVEIDGPTTSVNSKNVYTNDATAIGAVTSLYVNLVNGTPIYPQELTSLSGITGLSSDELDCYDGVGDPSLVAYYGNSLSSQKANSDYFGKSYQRLYVINAALEGLKSSIGLTPAVKQHLIGEAYFMRAFYYFYLVNLYGDVPLVLSTDHNINSIIKKSKKKDIYLQIIVDLKESQALLSESYLKGDLINAYSNESAERIRPTKWAAIGLLARTYLYIEEWANAEIESSKIIDNHAQFRIESLDKVFLRNNYEAIWQLQPTTLGRNTEDANVFVLPPEGPSSFNPVYISGELINEFEIGDLRKANWINSINVSGTKYYYPYKYKVKPSSLINDPVTEYSTVMRLAEQYLIRAESRARLNNLVGAIQDVDQIRKRAGLTLVDDTSPTITKDDLITLILKERRIEFFTEWGHRWFDLKRTGKIDEVMMKVTPKKNNGGTWKSYQQYYPIWSYELQANPNLIQTPGY